VEVISAARWAEPTWAGWVEPISAAGLSTGVIGHGARRMDTMDTLATTIHAGRPNMFVRGDCTITAEAVAAPTRTCRIVYEYFNRKTVIDSTDIREAYSPRSAGCDNGPLMMGAPAGDESGAGIRLSKAGICGAAGPRRVVGLSAEPPRADACAEPRARLGVDPTIQVTANIAAKRRCMVVFLSLFCLPSCPQSNDPTGNGYICIAFI
jgi:hypothetical protein